MPSPKFPAMSAIPRLTQGSRHVVGLTGAPITPLCAPFIYTGSHCQPMPSVTTQPSPPRSSVHLPTHRGKRHPS